MSSLFKKLASAVEVCFNVIIVDDAVIHASFAIREAGHDVCLAVGVAVTSTE